MKLCLGRAESVFLTLELDSGGEEVYSDLHCMMFEGFFFLAGQHPTWGAAFHYYHPPPTNPPPLRPITTSGAPYRSEGQQHRQGGAGSADRQRRRHYDRRLHLPQAGPLHAERDVRRQGHPAESHHRRRQAQCGHVQDPCRRHRA